MMTAQDMHRFLAEATTVATDQPCLRLPVGIRRSGNANALAARSAR
jgi:hypothetical protein